MNEQTRRQFLQFTGRTAALAAITQTMPGFAQATAEKTMGIAASREDAVVLAAGLEQNILISWGDKLNNVGDSFGFNNDYTALFPLANADEALLWVNHEEVSSGYFQSPREPMAKLKKHIYQESKLVGGSILRIRQEKDVWRVVIDDDYNKRIDGTSPIPIISARPIAGSNTAMGMVGNCAGGVTPWKTVLSCEENFHFFYGDVRFDNGIRKKVASDYIRWDRFLNYPPEHYGWVVEINPLDGQAKKLTSLGRFAHECATTVAAADGRCAVYMADDKTDECIYKFIASEAGSLEQGTLYVADTDTGRWLALDIKTNQALASTFIDQTELLIRTREAARIIGGTPQARPEDIERDPNTGAMYVALTKSDKQPYGGILKIIEKNNDPLAMEFTASMFLPGGEKSGFACPDNMVFDPKGNLWLCTDISSSTMNKGQYGAFKNNGLFYIPMSGPQAGIPVQLASAPVGAEFTGPSFSADGKHLFLSVQHPGEGSPAIDQLSSHWPLGGNHLPKPSVITLQGPLLDRLCAV